MIEPYFIPFRAIRVLCLTSIVMIVFANSTSPVIAGTAHPFGGVAICSDDYIEAGDFPPDILYMTLPQLDRSLLPKGRYFLPLYRNHISRITDNKSHATLVE